MKAKKLRSSPNWWGIVAWQNILVLNLHYKFAEENIFIYFMHCRQYIRNEMSQSDPHSLKYVEINIVEKNTQSKIFHTDDL